MIYAGGLESLAQNDRDWDNELGEGDTPLHWWRSQPFRKKKCAFIGHTLVVDSRVDVLLGCTDVSLKIEWAEGG